MTTKAASQPMKVSHHLSRHVLRPVLKLGVQNPCSIELDIRLLSVRTRNAEWAAIKPGVAETEKILGGVKLECRAE